jgi:hypothetical protein
MNAQMSDDRAARSARVYLHVKDSVIARGFQDEIQWHMGIDLDAITEAHFLREAAWVVLSAGMREAVVRPKFGQISKAFFSWKDARLICSHRDACVSTARTIFNHERKIEAIADIAAIVNRDGLQTIKTCLQADGAGYLQTFPYIGPITCYHLAKNLGLNTMKPDRHLVRMAAALGYESPFEMCQAVAPLVGDKISTIDLVMWRYATLDPSYLATISTLCAYRLP